MKRFQKLLIGLVVAAMTIGTGAAWADYGSGGKDCSRGKDGFHGKGSGYGRMMDELSEADQEKAKAVIKAFRESNREIKRSIHQKRLALEAEMAKPEPDAAVAENLQKELSALHADAAQKRLAYRIEMKKIHPDLGRGFHQKGFGGKRGDGGKDCPKGLYGKRGDGNRDCPYGKGSGSRN